jgi:hypothetical protein
MEQARIPGQRNRQRAAVVEFQDGHGLSKYRLLSFACGLEFLADDLPQRVFQRIAFDGPRKPALRAFHNRDLLIGQFIQFIH